MTEGSFPGRGDEDTSGTGVGDDDGPVDGFGSDVAVAAGVFVGRGASDGAGVPVAAGVFVGRGARYFPLPFLLLRRW